MRTARAAKYRDRRQARRIHDLETRLSCLGAILDGIQYVVRRRAGIPPSPYAEESLHDSPRAAESV